MVSKMFTYSKGVETNQDNKTDKCPGPQIYNTVDTTHDQNHWASNYKRTHNDAIPQSLTIIADEVHNLQEFM